MEVVNARAALLSNFEVLSLLRELEKDYITRSKDAQRIKYEEGSSLTNPPIEDISENLRTMEVEAIQYLSADFQPTGSQTTESVTRLTKELSKFRGLYEDSALTKAERLQIVNLAPKSVVELYVIVEELEQRFSPEEMEEIIECVQSSLSSSTSGRAASAVTSSSLDPSHSLPSNANDYDGSMWEEEDPYDAQEDVFDDTGEGAGIEGDLDMEEE